MRAIVETVLLIIHIPVLIFQVREIYFSVPEKSLGPKIGKDPSYYLSGFSDYPDKLLWEVAQE